jgi:hypothetical protein
MKTTFTLCRSCGSRLDERLRTRGRHWNCELAGWQIARDERDTLTMGERHLVSTGVRWAHCGCGGWVLVAIAEGIATAVDPAIVDPLTELNELLKGRRSFDLVRIGGRTELMHRDLWRQKTRDYPVTLEHNCGRVVSVNDPIDVWKKAPREKKPTKSKGSQRPASAAPPPF